MGYVVLLGLAAHPIALMAVGCAMQFLFGLLTFTWFRYGVFLYLISFNVAMLCEYRPGYPNVASSSSGGSSIQIGGSGAGPAAFLAYFYHRIAGIGVALGLVLLVSLTLLPWYNSVATLDTVANVFRKCTQVKACELKQGVGHYAAASQHVATQAGMQ